jgi:hypothetical protein
LHAKAISWAYTFGCDMPLARMCVALNEGTTYRWHHHDDSAWYLEYLSCRPREDVRFRIHNLQESDGKGPLLSAQIDGDVASRAEFDAAFLQALALLPIRDLRQSEVYD